MVKFTKLFGLLLVFALLVAACRQAPPEVAPEEEAPQEETAQEEETQEEEAAPEPTEAPEEEVVEEEAAEEEEAMEEAEEAEEEMAEEDSEMAAEEEAMDAGPVKIGFMGPLTGGAAFIGQEQLGFAQVFVDEFNERTGMNVELVEGDTEINPDTGKIVAEQFAADSEMLVVVGPAGSQVCESTQPVFEEAGLAHLTPSCTRTDLTDPGTATFFRPIPTDDDQSATIADHMLNTLGVTSAYLVDDQSSYSVGLADQLEALLLDAGASVERASVTQEETDFSSIATTAVTAGVDVVFMPGQIEGQLGTLAVQLREQGFEGTYYLPDGGFSLGWIEAAGEAAEGTYVTFFSPDPNLVPTMAPYNEAYAADYSEEFGAFGGASGYTTFVALSAIEACASDLTRACVVDALANINLETTPLGLPVSFGDGNQINGGTFSLFQIQDGAFNLISGDDAMMAEETMEAVDFDGTIKVAFLGPLTGGAAFIGQEQLGFAQVTAELFSAETGINIEIVEGDTEINPDTGKIVAEQVAADDEVLVVVGPAGSQVCEATQPVFADAGLAHLTPSCTRTTLTDPGTATFFRPIPTDDDQSTTIASHMIDTLGVGNVYMVEDQSSYAVGLVDQLEGLLLDAGVTVDRASVTQEETDFSSIATTAVASGADTVFMAGQIEGQLGTLAVQLREQGFEGTYYLPDGGFSLGWIEAAGDAAEGTYVTFFAPDPNLVPTMGPYNEAYAAAYSEDFGAFGGASSFVTYVALEAVESCVKAGDVTRACVVDALGSIDLETTPLGLPVSFGDGNQINGGSFSLFQIQDGVFNLISGDDAMMDDGAMGEELAYDGTIKVAFLGPLTGGAAFIGQEQLGFAQVFIDDFAAETGLTVEIVEGDTEINPDTGKIVAEQVAADDEVLVVVGPAGSQVCEATQPVFEEAGLAHLTPSCTRTTLTDPGTATFFRPIPTDDDQSATIASHMIDSLAVSNVYMVEDQSSYAVGLVDQLEELLLDAGVTVDRASVTQEETDFSSIATTAVASGADTVFMAGQIEGQLGTLAVQLREQGFEGTYYLPDGGFSLGWIEAAGDAAEGTYVTFFAPDPNLVDTMAPYNEAYAAAYSEDFGAFGGASGFVTYVALEAVRTCVADGDVTRACVVDALSNIDLDTTPLGLPVSFGDGNQINGGSFSLFQIQDGAFNLLSE